MAIVVALAIIFALMIPLVILNHRDEERERKQTAQQVEALEQTITLLCLLFVINHLATEEE